MMKEGNNNIVCLREEVYMSKLETGIYFVKVQLENGQMAVRKFVKT